MKRLCHFIFSHSIFVSLCAAALAFQSFQLHGVEPRMQLCWLAFFFTLAGYNAYWLVSKHHFNQLSWKGNITKFKSNSFFIVFGTLGGSILAFLNLHSIIPITITALLSIVYTLPFIKPFADFKLRVYGSMKMVVLALVWTSATAVMPLSESADFLSVNVAWILLHRFSFILMLNFIFDVGDATNDRKLNVYSFATENSNLKIYGVMFCISLLYIISSVGIQWPHNFYSISLPLILLIFPIWFLFLKSFRITNYYFYYGLTDGMMLCSAILIYLTRNL